MIIKTLEQDGFEIWIKAEAEELNPEEMLEFKTAQERDDFYLTSAYSLANWFYVTVTAHKHDIELGEAGLGCCSYANFEEFINDEYCKNLIDNAIEDAKAKIKLLISEDK